MRGHIRKRGSSWSIVIELPPGTDGKRRQKWHTCHGTKKDAEREMSRLLNEVNTGSYVEPQKSTIGEYLERWLEHTVTQVATRTQDFYTEAVRKHLIPGLGSIPLSKLQPLHIQAYYDQALKSGRRNGTGGLSPQTVGHHHRVLSSALRQAVKWQLLARNPCEAADPPRVVRQEMQALSAKDAQALLGHAHGTWLYLPVLIAITTGLRRGEILGLCWKDVDLMAGTLTVRQAIGKGGLVSAPKTKQSRRTISLPPATVDALRNHKAAQSELRLRLGSAYEDQDLVVAQGNGRAFTPDYFTHAFGRLAKRAGFEDLRLHDLRHTSATLLLTAGVDLKTVSGRLGHSSATTTLNIYAHTMREMDQHAAARMDQILGGGAQA